jgi:hypothetical protein
MSEEYTYRRKLRATELLPAAGAAVGVGLAVFYVARLLLQRTPVLPTERRRTIPQRAAPSARLVRGESSR